MPAAPASLPRIMIAGASIHISAAAIQKCSISGAASTRLGQAARTRAARPLQRTARRITAAAMSDITAEPVLVLAATGRARRAACLQKHAQIACTHGMTTWAARRHNALPRSIRKTASSDAVATSALWTRAQALRAPKALSAQATHCSLTPAAHVPAAYAAIQRQAPRASTAA